MKKVILYTSPTCVFCPLVKWFLEEKGVDYEEVDITKDKQTREEMKKKTGQMNVPVTSIGDKIVIGFDKKKLLDLIAGD